MCAKQNRTRMQTQSRSNEQKADTGRLSDWQSEWVVCALWTQDADNLPFIYELSRCAAPTPVIAVLVCMYANRSVCKLMNYRLIVLLAGLLLLDCMMGFWLRATVCLIGHWQLATINSLEHICRCSSLWRVCLSATICLSFATFRYFFSLLCAAIEK